MRKGSLTWKLIILIAHAYLSGELQSVDGYMNIALEQTKEYVKGKLRREYGDAFVRGNNGQFHLWNSFGNDCALLQGIQLSD